MAGLGVLYADKVGLSWVRGKQDTVNPSVLLLLHRTVGTALIALIASGAYMFWPMRSYLLHQPLFFLKMGFVAALVINSLAIDRLMHLSTHTPFRLITQKQKAALMLSGAVSLTGWVGAAGAAWLLF